MEPLKKRQIKREESLGKDFNKHDRKAYPSFQVNLVNCRNNQRKGRSKANRHPKNKEKSSFFKELKNRNKAFVLFYASWCPHSQKFLPFFGEHQKNPKDCFCIDVGNKPDVYEEYKIDY